MPEKSPFDLTGKVAVVTGGSGVLGSALARGLAEAGASVVVASTTIKNAQQVADDLNENGNTGVAVQLDVFNRESLEQACAKVIQRFGQIDVLVNGVGGNMKEATTSQEHGFFDMPRDAMNKVMELNLLAGVIAPSQIFGREMVKNPNGGSIINISSMNAFRPLTRIPVYSAAKAAVSNFTQWLAVHLAQEYSPKLRVNALAPGFFLTDQNRFLLHDEGKNQPTARGQQIMDHTPMGRYGAPEDLVGTTLWLASDASKFVTGIVVPVDGGFSAYSGV